MNTMTPSQLQERIDAIHAFEKTLIDSMTEGRHFYVQTNMLVPRQILSKGGAEYLAKLFNWTVVLSEPRFTRVATHKGEASQQVYFEAHVVNEKNQILAYGGGARSLTQDAGSLNTALKMARKSAFVDAVLRGSGLSSYFDQDVIESQLDDEPRVQNQATTPAAQPLDVGVSPSPENPKAEVTPNNVNQIAPIHPEITQHPSPQDLAEHKKALEELKHQAMESGYGVKDVPGLFQCNVLEELTLEQIKEAQAMVHSILSHRPQHNLPEEDQETDFVMV